MKYEIRFEAKTGRNMTMWTRRVGFLDDAEEFDTFKGFDSLRIEVRLGGRVIDTYSRERRQSK